MTAAVYAQALQAALPGWTVTPDPIRPGAVRIVSPVGALGLVRARTGAVGHEVSGIAFWTHPRSEYTGARGARRLAADLLAANPLPEHKGAASAEEAA